MTVQPDENTTTPDQPEDKKTLNYYDERVDLALTHLGDRVSALTYARRLLSESTDGPFRPASSKLTHSVDELLQVADWLLEEKTDHEEHDEVQVKSVVNEIHIEGQLPTAKELLDAAAVRHPVARRRDA